MSLILHLRRLLFLLHLARGAQVQCHARDLYSLKIQVEDSNHLRISWEDVFRGCQDEDIQAVFVPDTKISNFKKHITKGLDTKTASLELNPCFTHSLSAQLIFTEKYNEEHGYPRVKSRAEDYSPLQQVCKQKGSEELVLPDTLKSCNLEIERNRTTNLVEVVSGEVQGDSVELEELEVCAQDISNNKHITAAAMGCAALTVTSLVLAFWLCTKKQKIVWQNTTTESSDGEGPVEFDDGRYRQVTLDNPYETRPQGPLTGPHGLHR